MKFLLSLGERWKNKRISAYLQKTKNAPAYRGIFLSAGILLELGNSNVWVYNINMISIEFLRQFRIGPFAIFDFVVAYGGLLLLSPIIIKLLQKVHVQMTWINIMWLVLPLSIIAHVLSGYYTPLTKMFLNPSDYYFVKILIVFMVYMGFRKVIW